MRIRESIYLVGVVDSEIRNFHGYEVPIGTTYNSYLVIDDEVTLVDGVQADFATEQIDNIKKIIGDRPIDNFIINHVEPDHSGSIPLIAATYPNLKAFGTNNALREIEAYYPGTKLNFEVVRAGDKLETSDHTFEFIPAPMVHWPDSMSTYVPEKKVLFSNDIFGQHIGDGSRFDHELDRDKLLERAASYYANIVLPFGMQVLRVFSALEDLDIEVALPSHGVILEDALPDFIESYKRWANGEVNEAKASIVYDTMWGTTAKLALMIRDEYKERGLDVELLNLGTIHYSDAMARLLESKYIAVGSPTLNNQMLPSVAAFLTYFKGLKPKNRVARAFGSFGWSGESIKYVRAVLEDELKLEMEDDLSVKWNVDSEQA